MEKSNKTVVLLLKINFRSGTQYNNNFFKQHRWEDCQKFRYFKLKVHINLFEEKLYDKNNVLFIEQLKVANLPYIPEATFDQNAPSNVQKWEPKMAFV